VSTGEEGDVLEGGPPPQGQAWPGSEEALQPPADHGEDSYRGARRLEDRVALVTGGDSGIGRAVALAFAREGADVAIAYLSEDEDAETTLELVRDAGRRGLAIATDLADRDACRRVIERTVRDLGGLNVLVNNAAYQCEQDRPEDLVPEQVERTFRTNILAYLWLAQAALEHMGEGDAIINTGSVTAQTGNAGLIDYASTKGAIHTFTKSLARAVADRGIRVNCVAPGPVWTPLIPATLDREHVARFGADTLFGRAAQPAELAPTYVLLASREGSYYQGEILSVTGRASSR
jgi:hypothetical protein